MNKHYYFLTVLFTTLIGVFTNLHAQEPANLGDYRITKIGAATNKVTPGQWYLVGRNPYMMANSTEPLDQAEGYWYDDSYETYDETSRVSNAACSGNTDHGTVSGWTRSGSSNNFEINLHSGSLDGVGDMPYAEVWVGGTTLSDATIRQTTNLTSLTEGYYRLTVKARIYCEDHVSPRNSNPTGVSFVAIGSETVSVDLSTGTLSADGFGYYGTYSLIVHVGAAGTLNFGFNIANATCNWLAFKDVTLARLGAPFSVINVANGNCSLGSAGTAAEAAYDNTLANNSATGWSAKQGNANITTNERTNARYNLGGLSDNHLDIYAGNGTSWRYDVTISRTITGLTNGTYTVSADVWIANPLNRRTYPTNGTFYAGTTSNNVSLLGDDKQGYFTSGGRTYYGYYDSYELEVEVTNGSLTLGITTTDRNATWIAWKNVTIHKDAIPATPGSLTNWSTTEYDLSRQQNNARYDLGDTWTGYAGDLYNNGNVFVNEVTVSHDQMIGLANGKYQISVDARVAGTEPTPVVNPTVTPVEFKYTYQSTVGSTYEDAKITIAKNDILAAIGASTIDDVNVFAEDSHGTRWVAADNGDVLGNTDGWRNDNGLFVGWNPGGDSKYCIKLNYKADTNQIFYIGGMNDTSNAASFSARFIYQNKSTLAEVPVIVYLNYGTSFFYEVEASLGQYYQASPVDVDIAAIRTAIGAADDNAYTVYASDGTSTVRGATNGWRNADGDFQAWGAESYVYVQDESKSHYVVGGHPDHCNEVGSYTTRLIYKHNTSGATAAVYITLKYTADFRYSTETPTGTTAYVNYWQGTTNQVVVDLDAIQAAIGANSTSDFTIYSEEPNGTRIASVIGNATIDGYRDASGMLTEYDAGAYFYVQDRAGDFKTYDVGGHPDHSTVPGSYTAKLIYRHNGTGKEVAVYITQIYTAYPYFYAGSQRIKLSTGTQHTGTGYTGYRGTYTLEVIVTNGTLDFGFTLPQGYWKWLSFKNVTLYYLGNNGVSLTDGKPAPFSTFDNTHPVLATDAKRYMVRFVSDGWGPKGERLHIQFGNGNYVSAPTGNGEPIETSDTPGKYFAYGAQGYRPRIDGTWVVASDGVFIKSTNASGSTYDYYLYDRGVGNSIESAENATPDEMWQVDVNANAVFALYPLDVCRTTPDEPTLSLDYSGKFYKIKNRQTGNYATYSTHTSSLYPELLMEETGGYAMITRAAGDLTGSSYWWFSDATAADITNSYQYFAAKGTKRVRIHNVMMHDMDYTPETHTNETLYGTKLGVTSGGRLYYLLPAASDGGHNYWALARSEYSTSKDAWFDNEATLPIIGQAGSMEYENPYNQSLNTQWELEEATLEEVWNAVKSSKRRELHEGAFFSPTTETLDPIFNTYDATPANQAELFTKIQQLGNAIWDACTDASLPTLAPEEGGRFYFRNYAATNHYFAENNGLTMQDSRDAKAIWEIIPFSDPTPLVRVDDQPLFNDFNSLWYHQELPHRPLQRFWLRNRSTGKFLTHTPIDKSGFTKISDGVWNMNEGGTPAFGAWRGNSTEIGTIGNLEREGADLWYFDVVSNPRTGLRTGVLRTLFCYDYGPWVGASLDGTYNKHGYPAGPDGDAIAGYNYPVVKLDAWNYSVIGGGVTATDNTRAFSQWVIYDIDTDLPEVGVNYTLKNKYSGMYAYWDGTDTDGSLQQTEKVEDIANNGPNDNQNRGVWTLVDLATPASDHWRIANRWAIASGQTKTKLNPLKLNYPIDENNGSTFYLPQSNVDPRGIAIGTSSNPPANGEGTWLISYDNKTGVTQGKSENDRAVWGIDKVDRMYDDVVYELSKMLSNVHDGQEIFWMNNVASYNEYITKWNQYSTGNYENVTVNNEYPTYKVIKDLINGIIGDDEFIMPVKKPGSGNRYLIRNKETGRYLTDYGQLMTVDSSAVSMYSIWNLDLDESNADKYLYTLTNEGAAHVMDAADGERTTKEVKYMTFDSTNGFQMNSTGMKLHFRPDGEGYARLHYCADGDHDMDDDKVLYGPSWGNRVVQSQVLKTNNVFWEVIPVAKFFTNARTMERFKTETALVQQTIRDMEGYSGGPISLTDTNPTTDKGLFKLNALPGAITGATGSAEGLATIIGNLWNLDEKFLLQWKPGFPVFLDNMCRPTPGARLTIGTETDWTTTATKDESTASQTFEFAGTMNGSYTLVNKSNSKFLATSTAEGATATATTEAANAAQLTVTEIVPSIYSIKDGENRYLSINDEGNVEWESICGYGALWRIKCNDYEQPTIQKISGVSQIWQGNFINTYSSEYDTQMKASDGVKVYYAKNATSGGGHGFGDGYNASGSTTNENTQKQLQITFYEVENEGGYYYLEAYQPYLIVKSPSAVADASLAKTKANNDEIKVWSEHKGTYESGTLVGKNLLTRLDNDVTIDATNHRKFYELNYIAPGTQVGSIGGQPVYAFGAGFYTPPIGRKFKAGKCVIEASAIGSWLSELRTKVNEVKGEVEPTAIEVILENLDGSTTDLTDLQLDVDNHLADGPVYDLSGRKIADSLKDVSHKGVYVVNGQKVLRK